MKGRQDNYGFPMPLAGEPLREAEYLVTFEIPDQPISNQPNWRGILRSFGLDVHLVNTSASKPAAHADATRAIVYRLNSTDFLSDEILERLPMEGPARELRFSPLPQVIPRRPNSDEVADFDQLADASEGVKWLSVLRMDVDNLGELFKNGLGDNASISRMCTLSETVRFFFEGYIPKLCRDYNTNHTPGILELIYAGGDDLFLVGGWSAAHPISPIKFNSIY